METPPLLRGNAGSPEEQTGQGGAVCVCVWGRFISSFSEGGQGGQVGLRVRAVLLFMECPLGPGSLGTLGSH